MFSHRTAGGMKGSLFRGHWLKKTKEEEKEAKRKLFRGQSLRRSVLSRIVRGSKFPKLSKDVNMLKKRLRRMKEEINLNARNVPL